MDFATLIKCLLNHKTDEIHFDYFDYEHFSDIREKSAGIYAWHLAPNSFLGEPSDNQINLEAAVSFFSPNDINLVGQTPFYNYNGSLNEDVANNLVIREKISNISNFEKTKYLEALSALIFFQTPIYIGISTTLKKRINQHADVLRQIHTTGTYLSSSDEEDRRFGDRIINFINNKKSNNEIFLKFMPSNFFIKVFYLDAYKKSQLEDLEYVLNRIIKPKFGKR